jgi:copper transport protein
MNRHRPGFRSAAVGVFVAALLSFAGPALAHIDIESSDPADQATLTIAPNRIELVFTETMEPAGDGMQLINAAGESVAVTVSQPAGDRVIIEPVEPLDAGRYGVAWTARAGDAHPKSGSLTFEIAPIPAAAGGGDALGGLSQDDEAGAADRAAAPGDVNAADGTAEADLQRLPLIAEPNTVRGEWLGSAGRWLSLIGVLVGIGVFAFAATALTGSVREVTESVYWVRRAGIAVIAGTVIEALAAGMLLRGSLVGAILPSDLASALGGLFGFAILLRLAGGIAMFSGASVGLAPFDATESVALPATSPPDAPSGGVDTRVRSRAGSTYRLDMSQSSVAVGGVAVVAISYLFDGHTATASPAWIVRIADLAHVFAAGVWLGGVLMLGRILTWRRRRKVPLNAGELAVRFSVVASVALTVVVAAGILLTWSILDSPGELVSTAWGRLLLIKLAAVGLAAALGGYNHFFVVPQLTHESQGPAAGDLLRRVVRVEGAVLVVVAAVTAILVGAAS